VSVAADVEFYQGRKGVFLCLRCGYGHRKEDGLEMLARIITAVGQILQRVGCGDAARDGEVVPWKKARPVY
jgi:hypothetical protein